MSLAFPGQPLRLHLYSDSARDFFHHRYLSWPLSPGTTETDAWELSTPQPGLLCGDREYRWSGPQDEWPLVLEMLLLQHVLRHSDRMLALHGAALAREGRGLCLLGDPGCGKTTLACSLAAHTGVELLSDELVCVDARRQLQPFPRVPDLSTASRTLLASCGLGHATTVNPLAARACTPCWVVILAPHPVVGAARLAVSGDAAVVGSIASEAGLAVVPEGEYWWLSAPEGVPERLTQAAARCWSEGVFVLGGGQTEEQLRVGEAPVLERLEPLEGLLEMLPHVRSHRLGETPEELLARVAAVLGTAPCCRLRLGPAAANCETLLGLWRETP